MVHCPEVDELEALVAGRIDSAELLAHLQSCAACRRRSDEIRSNNSVFDRLVAIGSAPAIADDRAAPRPAELPAIDGYRVVAELHRGGQGVIFEAVQLSTQRKVALKVLLEGAFATRQQLQRFDREIETVLRLRHPNLVPVYDCGTTRDGRRFFAMEFVEGVTLDRHARDRRAAGSSRRETLELFGKVCAAVNYAHQRGVIHRDLKPGNVLVDPGGEPRVLDFGLAKAVVDEPGGVPVTVTSPGWFLGTLVYASPEQLRGDPNRVDVRSDVYSLGVILFELLTGAFPYPVEGALPDVVRAIQDFEPRFPRGLDDELTAILQRALAKEREHRYQSAGELARDLDRYSKGEPIEAKRGRLGYLLRKAVRRHRVRAAAAALMLIVIVTAAIVSTVAWRNALREKHDAEVSAKTRHRVAQFVENMLASVHPDLAKGRTVTVREVLDDAAHRLDVELNDEPAVEVALRSTIGRSYLSLGLFEEAQRNLERALELHRPLHPEGSAELAANLVDLACAAYERADYRSAEARDVEALTLLDQLGVKESLDRARALNQLALARQAQGDLARAEPDLQRALALFKKLGDEQRAATALTNLGALQVEQGRLPEAQKCLEEAIAFRREHGETLNLASTSINLARLHERAGRFDAARACLEESLRIYRKLLGNQDPLTIATLVSLTRDVERSQGYAAARELHREAEKLRPALEGRETIETAWTLNDLGLLARAAGDLATAANELSASVALYDRLVGAEDRRPMAVRENLCWVLYLLGRFEDAAKTGQAALDVRRRRFAEDGHGLANLAVNVAWCLVEIGPSEQAEKLARDSLELRTRLLGEKDPQTCRSRNALAWALHLRGGDREAETLVRQNLEVQKQRRGERNSELAWSQRNLAEILHALQRDDEAEPLYQDAVDAWRKISGDSGLELAIGLDSFGVFLLDCNREEEAGPPLQEALKIRRRQLGVGHPLLARSLYHLGAQHLQCAELDEAEPLLLEAHAISCKAIGELHPQTLQVVEKLARLYDELDRPDQKAKYGAILESARSGAPANR